MDIGGVNPLGFQQCGDEGRAGVGQFHREGGPALGRGRYLADVNPTTAVRERGALPSRADSFQSEIPGVRIGGLPESHRLRRGLGFHPDRAVRLEEPGEVGVLVVLQDVDEPGQSGPNDGFQILTLGMVGVQGITQPLGAGQVLEVELGGIRQEKLIARRVHHQLAHGQTVPIGVGINNPDQVPPSRGVGAAG